MFSIYVIQIGVRQTCQVILQASTLLIHTTHSDIVYIHLNYYSEPTVNVQTIPLLPQSGQQFLPAMTAVLLQTQNTLKELTYHGLLQ